LTDLVGANSIYNSRIGSDRYIDRLLHDEALPDDGSRIHCLAAYLSAWLRYWPPANLGRKVIQTEAGTMAATGHGIHPLTSIRPLNQLANNCKHYVAQSGRIPVVDLNFLIFKMLASELKF
jgi:hypothetical protein